MLGHGISRVVSVFRYPHKTDVVIMRNTQINGERINPHQHLYKNISTASVKRLSEYFFNNLPSYASATFDKGLDVVTMTFGRPLYTWME